MKKLRALLNTPVRAVVAVGLIILIAEFLIMALFDAIVIQGAFPFMDGYQWVMIFNYLDPILLIAIVAPTLYILIFRPMRNQQDELEVAHRKVERAHREWMAALDVVDDPIFLHDKQFRILRCNKAYQQRAGIPLPEIIGQPYYEIFPKAAAPLPCCLRALEKEEAEEEMTVGDAIYRSRAFSVHDEQGAYLYSVHTLEDITERKRASEAIIKAEAKFHTLFDSLSDAIFIIDMEGHFLNVNNSACKHLGYSKEELLQMRPTDIDAPEYAVKIPERIKLLQERGKLVFESAHVRKDGVVIPIELSTQIIDYNGKPAILGAARDITERKRAEAELLEQLDELRGWHDITLGREMRVLELKHEVDELLAQAGQPPRYPSAESDDPQEK